MIQEQVDEKTVALSMKTTKITGRILAKAMTAAIKKIREPRIKHGEQSLRSLSKQGASLKDIEITGDNIGSFSRVARKYHVDFALKKDESQMPPKWYVFFKAKDTDVLTAAFNEFSSPFLKKTEKPSIHSMLDKAKAQVSQIAPPVRNRDVGGHEL